MTDMVKRADTLPTMGLMPTNFDEAWRFAKMIQVSGMATKGDTQETVMTKIIMGAEVGLSPMQAIQNIAVINGRPSVWGDAMVAIVQAHPQYAGHREWFSDKGTIAHCEITRQGQASYTVSYSVDDAKKAGLWGKQGPWSQYPKRMLQQRARSWAFRDKFADALRGISQAEEQQDVIDVTPVHAPVMSEAIPEFDEVVEVVEVDDATASTATPAQGLADRAAEVEEPESLAGGSPSEVSASSEAVSQPPDEAEGAAFTDQPPELSEELYEAIEAKTNPLNVVYEKSCAALGDLPANGHGLLNLYRRNGKAWAAECETDSTLRMLGEMRRAFWAAAADYGYPQPEPKR